MKTTFKEKFRSTYQSLLDYFTWLLKSEKKEGDSLYEIDEDVVEEELSAVMPKNDEETIQITEKELKESDRILFNEAFLESITKKQRLIYNLMPDKEWVSSSVIGNAYCEKIHTEDIRGGGSQYASKTLNDLVKCGLVEKNNKKQYRKL